MQLALVYAYTVVPPITDPPTRGQLHGLPRLKVDCPLKAWIHALSNAIRGLSRYML